MIDALDEVFERLADLEHVESRQLRLFTIDEVDTERLRVRCRYENGELSGWYPWATTSSRVHHPPVVGETCLLVMQHGEPELAVALCGVRYGVGEGGHGPDGHGNADVLQGAYRYDRESRELWLGTSDPEAETEPVAVASAVRIELDALWDAIVQVRDDLAGHGHIQAPVAGLTAPPGGGPVTGSLDIAAPMGIKPITRGAQNLEPTDAIVRVPRRNS